MGGGIFVWEALQAALGQLSHSPLGNKCPRSLYAQAETTIIYDLPAGYSTFVAAAGLGTQSESSSVVFKVFVDEKEKFSSGVFRCGSATRILTIDIKGARKLKLVTTDAGDGIGYDYAWWGDARLIRE